MASFRFRIDNKDRILLDFITNRPNGDGTNSPVVTCQHVFTADSFKKFAERGQQIVQAISDIADAKAADKEFANLDESAFEDENC